MIAIQTSERNGKVVAATLASTDDEIMLITSGGVLIRTRVNEIARWALDAGCHAHQPGPGREALRPADHHGPRRRQWRNGNGGTGSNGSGGNGAAPH